MAGRAGDDFRHWVIRRSFEGVVFDEVGVESGRGRNPTLRIYPVPFDDVSDGILAGAELTGDPTVAPPAVDGMQYLRREPV